MKAHTTLLVAVALLTPLPAVAEPSALPRTDVAPAAFGERESPWSKGYGMPVIVRAGENAPLSPIFIAPHFEQDEAAFAAALPQAYFLHWRKGEAEHVRIPAKLRHATVGDALQHWEQYVLFARGRVTEADRADFARRDPHEVLEHVWMTEPPPVLRGDEENLRLTIPGLGGREPETGGLHDLVAATIALPFYDCHFRVEKLSDKHYRLLLHATLPMDAAALDAALQEARAYVVPVAEADKLRRLNQMRPLARQEDGSWSGEGVRLRFNREASEPFACERTLSDGQTRRGYSQLVFEVEQSGEEPLHLYTSLNLPSVYGREGIRDSYGAGTFPLFQADLSQAKAPEPPREPQPVAVQPEGDIALVQLPGKHDYVAFAYRLSDSAPLAAAELQLLDEEGALLATYAVKEGIVQGEMPAGARLARLVCGEESCELPVDMKLYEPRPHPDAPDLDSQWARARVFTDRRAYRPGDTVHFYGFVREFRDKCLHFPQGLRAELCCYLPRESDGTVRAERQPLEVAEDGTFMGSFTLPQDMKGQNQMNANICWLGRRSGNTLWIPVRENSVPALRMDGGFSLQGRELRAQVKVCTVDGAPLAGRGLRWEFHGKPVNPVLRGHEDYCFGDHRPDAPLPERCKLRRDNSLLLQSRSTLDAEGRTEVRFGLPQMPFPRRWEMELTADCGYAYTENGMRSEEHFTLDPASLYVGLRRESCLTPVGERLPLSLLLMDNKGRRYAGEPVEVELAVQRRRLVRGRFGEGMRLEPVAQEVSRRKVRVPAEGCSLELPLGEPGVYDIVVRGQDAAGSEFASAIRQYVWQEGTAPWIEGYADAFPLEADKFVYHLGDTAHADVPGEVEGEALIMIQGPESRRFLRQAVKAGARRLSIPLLEEDGPAPTVEVVLVQGRGLRARNGLPAIQRGSCRLNVENDSQHRLRVRLDELPECLPAGESVEVSGRVCDAGGQPVPYATVFVLAQEVGMTASYTGLDRPELCVQEQAGGTFTRSVIGVRELPSLPQLRFHGKWHYGQSEGMSLENVELPTSFNSPLMQRIKADAEGRFCARLTLPRGLADYQVIAHALGTKPVQSGADATLLRVEIPLTLRAVEPPASARVGDVLVLPLQLRLFSLPKEAGVRVRLRLSPSEFTGAECLQGTQEVELAAGQIMLLRMPVRLTSSGTARLSWRVEAVEGQKGEEGLSAEVGVSLPVIAAAPQEGQPSLTRRYERRTDVGQWEPATHFKQGDIVRITIEMEGRTLESEQTAIHDNLPTGWLPILHPYTDNCAADWVPAAIAACLHQSGWGRVLDQNIRYKDGCLTHPKARKGAPLRLCYLARVTCCGEFTVPPACVEGEVEACSSATRVVVE